MVNPAIYFSVGKAGNDNGFVFSNIIKEYVNSIIEYSAVNAADIFSNSVVFDLIGTIAYDISFPRNTVENFDKPH